MQDINIDTNEKKKRRKIKFKWRYKGKKGTYPGHEYDYSAIFIIIGYTWLLIHRSIYFIIQDALREETNSDENLQQEKENY